MSEVLERLPAGMIEDRLAIGKLAAHDLIWFAQLNNPDNADQFNPWKSKFDWLPFHRLIAAALEKVEKGQIDRLEIELPPRYGKSQMAVREWVPWMLGRHPERSGIVITHTDSLALEHGRDVRDALLGPAYRLVFGCSNNKSNLRPDSRANDRLKVRGGGVVQFSGRAGLGAGLSADWLLFDDFFKNSEEAQSQTVRDSAWHTFTSDCKSRMNNDKVPIIIIGSRRHEDDVQGRLFDPTNLHYDAKEAARWTRIRLPALAEADDPLGRAEGEPLWPEKFGRDHLEALRDHPSEVVRLDFQTQYQCNCIPSEGNYFKQDWIRTYTEEELPQYLRFYGASDHAYRAGQGNDRNCLLVVGIDPSDVIWVMPDSWWQRSQTDAMVEAMIDLMARHGTSEWWAARDAISGSVGPFLRKRQRERGVLNHVNDDIREDKDLERRAQSIRNRMAMGMVRFPSFASWWPEASNELLAFPNGKHDDLVAALAMLGMGMDKTSKPSRAWQRPANITAPPMTIDWIKGQTKEKERAKMSRKAWE